VFSALHGDGRLLVGALETARKHATPRNCRSRSAVPPDPLGW
jgi:hypothetical protein